jgi:hypothetical protein
MKSIINNIDRKAEYNPITIIIFSPDYYDVLEYTKIKDIEDNIFTKYYKVVREFRMEKQNINCDGVFTETLYKIDTKNIVKATTELYIELKKLELKNFLDKFYIIVGPVTRNIKSKIRRINRKLYENERYYCSDKFKKQFQRTLKKELR